MPLTIRERVANAAVDACAQVTNEDDVIAALDLAESAFGEPVNTAVNCAGVAHAIKTLSKKGVHQLFQFQQTLTVNTVGSFNVARLAAER